MIIVLNPLAMKVPEHEMLLKLLFNSNLVQVKWMKNHIYSVTDERGATYNLQLTHDILPLTRDNQLHYRVISEAILGKGGFGQVHSVECTLNHNIKQIDEPELVVKIVNYRLPKECSRMDEYSAREYRYSASLHMESPIVCSRQPDPVEQICFGASKEYKTAYMVMRRVPGKDLFAVLEPSYKSSQEAHFYPLYSRARYLITNAVLTAFKTQLVNENIMHGDIKIENIMLNTGLEDSDFQYQMYWDQPVNMVATVIDFETSRYYGEALSPNDRIGTYGYIAPETREDIKANQQIDIYALGFAIRLIWALDTNNPAEDNVPGRHEHFFENEEMSFTIEQYQSIHQMTLTMIAQDPADRGSIEDIISRFNDIFTPVIEPSISKKDLITSNNSEDPCGKMSPVSVAQIVKSRSEPHNYLSVNERAAPCFFKSINNNSTGFFGRSKSEGYNEKTPGTSSLFLSSMDC